MFLFDPPSDEEIEHYNPESEEESEEEQGKSESESGVEEKEEEYKEPRVSKKKTQSPWDFTKYSESVAEEHARRSTTSVDDKIYAVRQRAMPIVAFPDTDDYSNSDSEPDKQVK